MVSGKLHHQYQHRAWPLASIPRRRHAVPIGRRGVDLSIGNVGGSVSGVGIIPAITGGSPIETFGVTRRRTWISNPGRRQHAPIRG